MTWNDKNSDGEELIEKPIYVGGWCSNVTSTVDVMALPEVTRLLQLLDYSVRLHGLELRGTDITVTNDAAPPAPDERCRIIAKASARGSIEQWDACHRTKAEHDRMGAAFVQLLADDATLRRTWMDMAGVPPDERVEFVQKVLSERGGLRR